MIFSPSRYNRTLAILDSLIADSLTIYLIPTFFASVIRLDASSGASSVSGVARNSLSTPFRAVASVSGLL